MTQPITDRDRLLCLWALATDDYGWGFRVNWNPQFDAVIIEDNAQRVVVYQQMVEKEGDDGDDEGRTFFAAIDQLITYARDKQSTNT